MLVEVVGLLPLEVVSFFESFVLLVPLALPVVSFFGLVVVLLPAGVVSFFMPPLGLLVPISGLAEVVFVGEELALPLVDLAGEEV